MSTKKPIYLFHGEDTYTSSQKLKTWKKEFLKKYENSDVEIIQGKHLKTNEFETNISTMPFLAEKRLTIIKDFLRDSNPEIQKKIADSLEKSADHTILVFYEIQSADKRTSLYKKINKLGFAEEYKNKEPSEISNWIYKESKNKNIQLDYKIANYLSNYLKPDLWSINNELDKLKLYADGKEITIEMIHNLIPPSLTSSIFKLTDSISTKNTKEALQTLKILKDNNEELPKIFFMIVRHFRILIQVKDLLDKGYPENEITKILKQHPFVIKKTSEQAKNFNLQKLFQIYEQLLEIDIGTKTGKIKTFQKDDRQLQLAIEKLIIQC